MRIAITNPIGSCCSCRPALPPAHLTQSFSISEKVHHVTTQTCNTGRYRLGKECLSTPTTNPLITFTPTPTPNIQLRSCPHNLLNDPPTKSRCRQYPNTLSINIIHYVMGMCPDILFVHASQCEASALAGSHPGAS
jgi:hypothetical protein